MKLIKINLLPYREAQEKHKKQQFKQLLLAAILLALIATLAAYLGLNHVLNIQTQRNRFIEQENQKLSSQLKEIHALKAEKTDFLARKEKVEALQNQRFQAARILDTLNAFTPNRVYLHTLTPDPAQANAYLLSGKALDDTQIAELMRVLPSTGLFEQAQLANIKKDQNLQDFTINLTVKTSAATATQASENQASAQTTSEEQQP
ncbi:MAG: PilN domain-containing protein [Neisseria sp.]|nr:PilN domain-containing protein [Neisseria sp.]